MIPILTTFLKYCPSPKLLNWRYTFPHLSKIDFPRARCWPPKRRFLPRLLRRCSVAAACECRSLHSAVYKFTARGMLWEIPLKKTLYKKKYSFLTLLHPAILCLVKLITRSSLKYSRFCQSVCSSITLSVCFWMIAFLVLTVATFDVWFILVYPMIF